MNICIEEHHGTRSGFEIHARPAASDDAEKRVGPLHHGEFPAGNQGRWAGDAGLEPGVDGATHSRVGPFDHERSSGGGIRGDERMQLRHFAVGDRALPGQCADPARAGGRGLPDHQPDDSDAR
ncbi:hypothetical protein SDC9_208042 [bioreactor metagenome]|uniref:Uncharacterized protein n=1 Tax=bioreactor metagenome TaxID=1076179 RepID=A0A645JIZ7_9ZZZZ